MIKHTFKRTVITASVLLLAATQAQANSFRLPEAGVRAMGMGNAFTAVADDASAMWYNPAGIAFLKGGNLMLGTVGILAPKVNFTSNSSNTALALGTTGNSDRKTFVIPHFHATFTDPKMGMSYGLSVTSPFGLESDWTGSPFDTTTSPSSLKSTTFSRIEMVNINPNVAFKITDHISIGAGFDYVYIKDIDFNTSILTQNADGDGWGGNVGLMYKGDLFSVGVSYRTQIAVRLTGTASSTLGGNTTITSYVKLPDMVNGGFAFHPTDTLTISAEADWTNWSKLDQLVFNYASALTLPVLGALTSTVTPEEFHPIVAAKVGIEWKANDHLRLRLGYNFDPSPVNAKNFSPGFAFEDRHVFAAGAGYDFTSALTVDVAYMYVKQKDVNQTASTGVGAIRNGRYKLNAHLAGLSMNYKF